MSPIESVVILGGTGPLGKALIPALLEAKFEVTCVSRPDSQAIKPPGVILKTADYTDVESLTAVIKGHDVLVEAFNPASAAHQTTILQAMLAAEIKHLVTPDFSGDTFHPNMSEARMFDVKIQAQREVERVVAQSGGKLSWYAIITSQWYDWLLENDYWWVKKEEKKITRYGSGNQRYSISKYALNGQALVEVLQNPDKYRNRPSYFANHHITTNELIEMIQGLGLGDWKVEDVDIDEVKREGFRLWEEDTANGVADRMHTRAYLLLSIYFMQHEENRYGCYYGDKNESAFEESDEALRDNLKKLLN